MNSLQVYVSSSPKRPPFFPNTFHIPLNEHLKNESRYVKLKSFVETWFYGILDFGAFQHQYGNRIIFISHIPSFHTLPHLTYFLQSCTSLYPSTSLTFLLLNGASNSPISLVTFVAGHSFAKNSFVLISLTVIVSFVALNTWNPNPLFWIAKSQICPRSRASM